MSAAEESEKKKEYLGGYLYCRRREIQLAKQIKELRLRKMNPSRNIDGMPRGKDHSDLSDYMAQLDELILQLEREQVRVIQKYKEIYDQIAKMKDGVEKEVLERHYLMGENWEVIAAYMNYTSRHITRLHGKALQEFKMPE